MKKDHSWNIFLDNQNLIEIADKKARYLFVINSLTVTYILSNLSNLQFVVYWINYLVFPFLVINAIAFVMILLVFYARYSKHTGDSPPKLVFFNDIVKRTEVVDYIKDFKKASDDDIETDILYQVYETSVICAKKFKLLNWAIILLMIELAIFFSIIVISI